MKLFNISKKEKPDTNIYTGVYIKYHEERSKEDKKTAARIRGYSPHKASVPRRLV
jgi:hypothetical protein